MTLQLDDAAPALETGVRLDAVTDADRIRETFATFTRAMLGLDLAHVDPVDLIEPGRYLAAFDGDRVIGGAASYTGTLTVPGGARIPHAAVSQVGVLPTHRRRGIVSALLRRQLDDAAARGELVASLRASEATIYERFGYGVATRSRSATVDRRRTELRDTVLGSGTIRLADDTPSVVEGIYASGGGVGRISRHDGWWRSQERHAAAHPGPRYTAVHSTGGADDGYVVYRPLDPAGWFTSREKTIVVDDLVAHSDAAYRGLLRHLFGLDLVDRIRFGALAVDDPLPLALTDERAFTSGPVHDETWLRLIDVERALDARIYRPAPAVVLAVHDPLRPQNSGVYEIGPAGVSRTGAPAEATVGVAELASAYLGGTDWWRLAATGRIVVHRPGAAERLDALFATDRRPFAGTVF